MSPRAVPRTMEREVPTRWRGKCVHAAKLNRIDQTSIASTTEGGKVEDSLSGGIQGRVHSARCGEAYEF